MHPMSAIRKRNSALSWVEQTLHANRAVSVLFSFALALMPLPYTNSAFFTMLVTFFFSNTANFALIAMEKFFFWIILINMAYIAIIFWKFNFTVAAFAWWGLPFVYSINFTQFRISCILSKPRNIYPFIRFCNRVFSALDIFRHGKV